MKLNLQLGTLTLGTLALAATMLGSQPRSAPQNTQNNQHIEVTASRFSFEPNEITVKKGEPVTITLNSKDVTHGLVIEQLGIRADIKKGQPEDVTVTPEATGTFQGQCAHFCGKGHASMIFTVHVVE